MPSMNVGSQVLEAVGRSVSPDQAQVKSATADLKNLVQHHQVSVVQALVEIVKTPGEVDAVTRLGAAIYLKNMIKSQWDIEDALSLETRSYLQKIIVPLIMSVGGANIKAMLLEVVETMARTDFPLDWTTLLPELTNTYYKSFLNSQPQLATLTPEDLRIVSDAVEIAHTAMKKYEAAARSNEILLQLKTILEAAQDPFLQMLKWASEAYLRIVAEGPAANRQAALIVSRMTTSSLLIIKCLHGVDLPEFFEDNLSTLMAGCLFRLLQAPNCQVADEQGEASESTLSDRMKTGCCELIREYVTKYAEEYMPYNVEGTRSIKICLENCPPESQHDALVGSALGCLAAVSAVIWGPECDPLKHIPDLLSVLCNNIILRNIELRQCDIEAAEEEPLQFVREGLEGFQRGARREGAAQLIKALLTHHEREVCPTLIAAVETSLARARDISGTVAPRDRLRLKEASTFLVTSMSIKLSTRTKGITEINQLVPMGEFLKNEILPIINDPTRVNPAITEEALLKGECLKFVCQFRRFIAPEDIKLFLPLVIAHLQSRNIIVYTHAASCLERLLTLKAPGEPFVDWKDPDVQRKVADAVPPLLALLRTDVRLLDNEYVSRCLWRVLMLGRAEVSTQALWLRELVTILEKAVSQPVNPIFTHYLFECVSSLSRIICIAVGSSAESVQLHRYVSDMMTKIIANQEASAAAPYCYQILGSLVDTLPLTVGSLAEEWRQIYTPIVQGVLQEERWKAATSNLPGIMTLLEASMERQWLFQSVLDSQIPRLFTFFATCLKYRVIPPALTFEFGNSLLVHYRQQTLGQYFAPMMQTLQAYLRKNAALPFAAYPAVCTFCGMIIGAALQSNGTLDLPLNANSQPDPIGALVDHNVTNLEAFLRAPWQACISNVKSMQERAIFMAALVVMRSHPLAQASPQAAVVIDGSLKTLAGVYRPDQHMVGRAKFGVAGATAAELGVVEGDERQQLLESMAQEGEKGIADMSSAYNKLAASSRRRTTELAELVSVEQLRILLQARGLLQ